MIINKLKDVLNKYGDYKIIDVELLNSSQNKVYKVTTDKDILVIKEFSLDAIKNYYYLKKRKEQIRISKILNDKGIRTILPIMVNNKSFILFKKHYYLIYNYSDSRIINSNEITLKHINILANTQSMIHKLSISNSLTCFYKKIKIDFYKQMKLVKNIDLELYNLIKDNINSLNILVLECNNGLKEMKDNLCISHNDYKLLNVLWNNYEMSLIDFDAMGKSNPTCSLCESAFTFSRYDNKINYNYYEEYLRSYVSNYGNIKEDFKKALFVAVNGKLQFLDYMFSKNGKKNNNYLDDTKEMIKELLLYYENIDKFNNIYVKITR